MIYDKYFLKRVVSLHMFIAITSRLFDTIFNLIFLSHVFVDIIDSTNTNQNLLFSFFCSSRILKYL